MAENGTFYENVFSYFESEFTTIKRDLESGNYDDYRDRVVTSQKIGEALHLLSPYVRSEWRARQLVKRGESLRSELLSARSIVNREPH